MELRLTRAASGPLTPLVTRGDGRSDWGLESAPVGHTGPYEVCREARPDRDLGQPDDVGRRKASYGQPRHWLKADCRGDSHRAHPRPLGPPALAQEPEERSRHKPANDVLQLRSGKMNQGERGVAEWHALKRAYRQREVAGKRR